MSKDIEEKKKKNGKLSVVDLETLIMSGSTDLRKISIPYDNDKEVEVYIRPLSALDLTKMNELTYQEIIKYASLNCIYKDNILEPQYKLTEYDLSQLKSGFIQNLYLEIDKISNVNDIVDTSGLKNS